MTELSRTQRDSLLAELELHKTEYVSLRTEILQWLDTERQLLNFSIIAIGIGLGFSPLIVDRQMFTVLLLLPMVFHVLLWEMLVSLRAMTGLSGYISKVLTPRVNTILDELGYDRQGIVALGWEARIAKRVTTGPALVWASITPTRHWVPILAIAACLVAFSVLANVYNYALSIGELMLVFANLAFLILAAIQNVLIISRYKRGTL